MTQVEQRKSNKSNDIFEVGPTDLDDILTEFVETIQPGQMLQLASGEWAYRNDEEYQQFFQQSQQLKAVRAAEQTRYREELRQKAFALAQAEVANRQKPASQSSPKPVGHNGTTNGSTPAKTAAATAGRAGNNAGNRQATRGSKGDFVAASDYFKPVEYPPLPIETIPPSKYELIQNNMELENAVDLLMREKIISVDTETSGLDPFDSKLLLIQIATTEICYIIDATKFERLGPLKRLLESDHILKLLQNAKFDYKMIKAKFGIELCSIYDTYLAEKLLTAGTGLACRLDEIVQRRLQVTMDKSVRKSFIGQSHANMSPEQFEYAVKDVMVLFPIYNIQRKKLKDEKLMETADLEFRCVMAVGDLELSGCYLDQDKWREILKDVAKKRDLVRSELMGMLPNGNVSQPSLFGETYGGAEYAINLNSGQQIMAEFKQLGIDLEDTSEATLSKHNHPVVKKLLEYRSHEKTLGSFGEGLLAQIHNHDKRIHPDFQQYGADTGRFSCSNPNVQQIPASSDFRSCFIPAPGYKLVTSDYSQAELRILAQLSQDDGFVTAFNDGIDLHILAASQMFQVTKEEVTKAMRSQAKAINFGLAYGMGSQGLALRIDKTVDEASALIEQYFKAFSGVQKWLEKTGRDAVRKGYVDTPLGRKRYFTIPDRDDPEYRRKVSQIDRQGKNAPIQGCVVGSTRIFEETTGYVPIETLCGRAVSVWDGTLFSKATVVYSGSKQLVNVTLWGGHFIQCSPDHRFLTRGTAGKDVWKTPAQFKEQDRIVLTESLPDWANEIEMPPHSCEGSWNARKDASLDNITNQAELGEWLGRVASDGSVNDGCIRLFIAEHEEAILPQMVAVSNQLGYASHTPIVRESRAQTMHKITVSSRGLVQQVRQLGIKERIPDCAWQDSQMLAGYLRGMFDGDGTVHPDGAMLTFGKGRKHLKWAQEVQAALLLFGISSRLNVYDYRINLRIFKKYMPVFCEKVGFMNPSKQQKALTIVSEIEESKIYGKAARVKSVEVTDEWIDMYDVVNSETSKFMANGMVVHNCNADMTKMALIFLRDKLRSYEDARVVNTVHDEIVVEVKEKYAEAVCTIVEQEMIRAGKEVLKDVPVVVDAKVGDFWSH